MSAFWLVLPGPVLVIATSAFGAGTRVPPAPTSFSGFGSGVWLDAVALFRKDVFGGVAGGMFSVIENVADVPLANVATEHVTAPVPPTAGGEQLNAGPLVCSAETNVIPAGTASSNCAAAASSGPLFCSVTMYVTSAPAA